MKAALRQAIDQLYEEYVGIHLKAKRIYRFLGDWERLWKIHLEVKKMKKKLQ